MPLHNGGQALLEDLWIEETFQAKGQRDGIGRARAGHLVQKPEALLGKGKGERLGAGRRNNRVMLRPLKLF